jgi:hypothetical protein
LWTDGRKWRRATLRRCKELLRVASAERGVHGCVGLRAGAPRRWLDRAGARAACFAPSVQVSVEYGATSVPKAEEEEEAAGKELPPWLVLEGMSRPSTSAGAHPGHSSVLSEQSTVCLSVGALLRLSTRQRKRSRGPVVITEMRIAYMAAEKEPRVLFCVPIRTHSSYWFQ